MNLLKKSNRINFLFVIILTLFTISCKDFINDKDFQTFEYEPINCDANYEGYIDLHTHPVANLGFGGELFYGSPIGDPAISLGNCGHYHGSITDYIRANIFRNEVVKVLEGGEHDIDDAFPDFKNWPKNERILHQQMYIEWIKRAWDGGLRIMVALAVSSHLMADLAETENDCRDDLCSMNRQIDEMIEMINQAEFMELATSSWQLRHILEQGKLAVVMGVEMDNLGNFYKPVGETDTMKYNANPTLEDIEKEIDRLYNKGVRYFLPIHITDNIFGGTALYNSEFNVPNKYNTGNTFKVEEVPISTSEISFVLKNPLRVLEDEDISPAGHIFVPGFWQIVEEIFDGLRAPSSYLPEGVWPDEFTDYPPYPTPDSTFGHRNFKGISPEGIHLFKYLMRKGLIIDIDHMSEKTVEWILENNVNNKNKMLYPINSGHNTLRKFSRNENGRTSGQLEKINQSGGLFGLGHSENPTQYLNVFREVSEKMRPGSIGFGTDANGLFSLPGIPGLNLVNYSNPSIGPMIIRSTFGNKTWDYNQEGFCHYGMLTDFINAFNYIPGSPISAEEQIEMKQAANSFVKMWELCELNGFINSMDEFENEVEIIPSPITNICPRVVPHLIQGDRNFNGSTHCEFILELMPSESGDALIAKFSVTIQEDDDDNPTTLKYVNNNYSVFPLESGNRITGISGSTRISKVFPIDGAGAEFGNCREGEIHTELFDSGPVEFISLIADTGGDDISDDDNCKCDSKILTVQFRPLKLKVQSQEFCVENQTLSTFLKRNIGQK